MHKWWRLTARPDPKYVKLREEALKLLKYQLDHNKGLFPTLLSIMRSFRHHDISDVWEAVGDLKFPVHVIFVCPPVRYHLSFQFCPDRYL